MRDIFSCMDTPTTPPRVHREQQKVRHREADRDGVLKLSSWFDYLQEAAANHAAPLGVGLGALERAGYLWVLSRIRLEIDRSPGIGEKLEIITYPNGPRRLFAARQFAVRDSGGAEIARASSRWLLLSRRNLRPARVAELGVELPLNPELPDYFCLEEKLPEPGFPGDFAVAVRHSMEDVNGHLNNAEYAGLIQDYPVAKNWGSPRFRRVEVHYLAAVRAPEILTVGGALDGRELRIEGRAPNRRPSFVALAELAAPLSAPADKAVPAEKQRPAPPRQTDGNVPSPPL